MAPPEACVPFDEIIPQAASHFDFADQTLIMSFPQAAMKQTARGTVPESQWDEGVNALCWIITLAAAMPATMRTTVIPATTATVIT